MDFNSARLKVEKPNFKFWFLDEFDDDKFIMLRKINVGQTTVE